MGVGVGVVVVAAAAAAAAAAVVVVGTQHALRLVALFHQGRQAEVANLDLGVVPCAGSPRIAVPRRAGSPEAGGARRTVDEYVVALEVSVDDAVLVEVRQPVEDLATPLLHYLALDALSLLDVPDRERNSCGTLPSTPSPAAARTA